MSQVLTLEQPENTNIPSERTVYRVMEKIGISHHPRRELDGITKAEDIMNTVSIFSVPT